MRRGNLVTGVTTAATLWLTTVIGLILGAGYLLFGLLLAGIAFVVLSALKRVEARMTRQHRAQLVLRLSGDEPGNQALRDLVTAAGYTVTSFAIDYDGGRKVEIHVEWYSAHRQDHAPALVESLAARPGIAGVCWEPVSAGHLFE